MVRYVIQIHVFLEKMTNLFANTGDPDQTLHYAMFAAESADGVGCLKSVDLWN